MKKLLFLPLLLLFMSLKEYKRPYAIYIIGTGSGAVSVTSMGGLGLHSGDILEIATQTGTYTSLTIDNLTGITVKAQSGRPVFTTGGQFTGNHSIDLSGISWNSTNGTTIDMTGGPNDSCNFHNLSFANFPGSVITANGNFLYTYGNISTYKWYKVNWDSISLFQCGFFIQGSFGSTSDNSGSPPDVFAHCSFTRLTDDATTATFEPGKEVHGICFGCVATDWKVNSPSGAANGDVGLIYGWGWWFASRLYKNGGNGYLKRIFPMQEAWDQGYNYIINSAKFNTSEYGLENYQYDTTGSISGHFFSTDGYIYNCEGGNYSDQIHYWCPLANNGQIGTNRHYYVKNCWGFNFFLNGKSPIGNNLGGWNSIAGDTSNNQYWLNSAQAKVDSLTPIITTTLGPAPGYILTANTPGIILHGGITNPFSTTDFLGNAMRVPPDLGYIQLLGTPPPPPGCPNCIPLRGEGHVVH